MLNQVPVVIHGAQGFLSPKHHDQRLGETQAEGAAGQSQLLHGARPSVQHPLPPQRASALPRGPRQPRGVQAGLGTPLPLAMARWATSCSGPADAAAGQEEPGSAGSKGPESRGQGQSAWGRQEVIQHGRRGALSRKMSFKYAWLCVLVTLKTIHNLEGDAVQRTRAGDSIRFLSLLLSPQEHGTRSNLSFLKSVITECNGNASKRLREQDPCFKS